MKKLNIITILCALAVGSANAQSTLKVVEKDAVPQAVATAFQKDFPGIKSTGWRILPKSELGLNAHGDYLVELALGDAFQPENVYDYYSVNFTGKGVQASATYDENGKLIISKEVLKNTALPRDVSKAIVTNYPGWKVVGDKEVIKNLDHIVYRVELQKQKDKQRIYLNKQGQVLEKTELNQLSDQ